MVLEHAQNEVLRLLGKKVLVLDTGENLKGIFEDESRKIKRFEGEFSGPDPGIFFRNCDVENVEEGFKIQCEDKVFVLKYKEKKQGMTRFGLRAAKDTQRV